jgi:uncharacterized protein (DUF885 family)
MTIGTGDQSVGDQSADDQSADDQSADDQSVGDQPAGGGAGAVAGVADALVGIIFTGDPLYPTLLGLPGYDDRLADLSADAEWRLRAELSALADRADALASATADNAGALTLAVAAQQARARIDVIDSRLVEYAITDLFVSPVAGLFSALPEITVPDAEAAANLITRLRAIPGFVRAAAQRHREGVAAGRTPVAHLVRAAIAQLDRRLATRPADLLAGQAAPPDAPSFEADRARVLEEVVWPALAHYRAVLDGEFTAPARPEDRAGLCWLPGGDAYYAALSRSHTTTDRTPEELHQTGLDLIARLAEEFAELGSAAFGTADRAEIFQRLRTDPALRWRDGEELLAAARTAIERAEAAVPQWFGRLPTKRCQVEPVPAAEAPGAPGAYYLRASLDGRRPGTYFANTYQADQRSRHTAEATAFHEAVPGHHFQITIAQELPELPLMRRIAHVTSFSEGWGLYCERLGDEMGLYSDTVSRLGMLALDSMRASRLVVDTGLHVKGWSRQRAVDYMLENTPMPALEISAEVDRYIATPGQALAYMVGRLEIERIRGEAARRLGDRFDIRVFHDRLLGDGALPLSVLDEAMTGWLDSQG